MTNKIISITLVTTLFIIISLNGYDCAKILGLFPFQSKSHFVMFDPILKALAEHGHEMDVVSHFPLEKKMPRYTDISLKGTLPTFTNNVTLDDIEVFHMSVFSTMLGLFEEAGTDLCSKIFDMKIIQDLYNNIERIKYDLILTEVFATDCFLVFAHKLKDIPIVGISTSVPLAWAYDRFGLPDNPSFIPNTFLDYVPPLTLYQRVHNTITEFMMKWSYYYFQTLVTDDIIRQKLGDNTLPSMYEMERKMSLLLINTHFSLFGARPIPPNVKEVAGLHIKSSHSLSKHFENIIMNSKNGVILFSLGSMIRTETFPQDKQRALIEAFGELPYNVIWKANKSELIGPFPKNIYFESWIPQQDILCHNNTKLFITHGGLMGTQEAIYCGVPMIGVPFFGDQFLNVNSYIKMGIASKLDYEHITKENVLNTINTILKVPSYENNIKQVSTLFRDRPMSPKETVIYWIDYVIRHKGARHLQPSSVELTWYQYYLFDVFCILILFVVLIITIIYLLVSSIYRQFVHKNEKLKKD